MFTVVRDIVTFTFIFIVIEIAIIGGTTVIMFVIIKIGFIIQIF